MKKLIRCLILLVFIQLITGCNKNDHNVISLTGNWMFRMDSLDAGIGERWFDRSFDETVSLPGSMVENGKGNAVTMNTRWTGQVVDSSWYYAERYARYRKGDNLKIPFWLQPDKHYVGAAWYKKEIKVPDNWADKRIVLQLERCHWETTVWVDDKEAGMQNSLSAPHYFDLTNLLSPGEHTLTVRVDNRIKDINPGVNAHSVSDHTQGNWNGITGTIRLAAEPLLFIRDVKVFPDVSNNKAAVSVWLENRTGKPENVTLRLTAKSFNSEISQTVTMDPVNREVGDGIKRVDLTLDMGTEVLLWDEFNPNLYNLKILLKSEAGEQEKAVDFGMREFHVNGSRFQVNERPVFLRGTLECSIFPKTGYPPTDIEEWTRIYKIIKTHGLNHVRFHSHCPPEAAFEAADREGIYLQVECGSWANSGSSLGDGKPIDRWVYEEADRILEAYGNHPSFCMMAYGNEPAGENQEEYLSRFVSYLKEKDGRRVYTGGAGWPFLAGSDYFNNPAPRIQGWGQELNSIINSKAPQTAYDFRQIIEQVDMPQVSHEIGQWCVYPNFKEIPKYTGVLKARNFEIFQESLEKNAMGHLADSFLLASGKLQALCYKADIEAALRTPGFAGFQLLDLHDFPGQGTALVGVLDPFWEEKGYISPEEFRRFCNQTVPLARLTKRVFAGNETITAEIEVAHFGKSELKSVTPAWRFIDRSGKEIVQGELATTDIPWGNGYNLGRIDVHMPVKKPCKLTLEVEIAGFTNTWDIWVYPGSQSDLDDARDIFVTRELNDQAMSVLKSGGSVLLTVEKGSLKPGKGGNIKIGFSSIFWNTAWTRGQAPHTLGLLCNPNHPLFAEFPTEYHSNWQWWDAMSHSSAIVLDGFSPDLKPIIRVIDDWFTNRRLALILEAKVGNGKLVLSGIDLENSMGDRIEARQLLFSIKKYMLSEQFNPDAALTPDQINNLFNSFPPADEL